MNINHHNYEEFFILYMDNELSSDDRRMVEAFVQQHPDLKEELNILQQYKLIPDTNIVFSGKEELLKVNGETPISLANYEEWLVLYIDNELSSSQKRSVDRFMAANPSVQEAFSLLQRTQLQPESIIFDNKEVLYRKEEKVRPMPVRWWRVAAAVLVFVIGTATVMVLNKKTPADKSPGLAKGTAAEQKNADNKIVTPQPGNDQAVAGNDKNAPVTSPVKTDNANTIITPVTNQPHNNAIAKQDNNIIKEPFPKNVSQNPVHNDPVIASSNNNQSNTPNNNLPKPLNNPNTNNNDASSNVTANVSGSEVKDPTENVTKQTSSPSNIQTASYTAQADNADLNQPNEKKSKLRGFFRKVTRTFEKRTNIDPTDDDRLLVGGLAIKLR